MWPYDQSLVTLTFNERSYINLNFIRIWTKNQFFWGMPLVQVNNLGLALVMALKFYNSVAKGLKLKGRKVWGLIFTLVEVSGKKLVRGSFWPSSILNRVKT